MTQSSQRVRVAGWLTHADPAGLLYGAIVSAAVLATVSAHAEGSEFVALATALVLVVYWMAHVYIGALSRQFDGDPRHFLLRLRTASAHESSVLKGGLPAIAVYVGTSAAGMDIGSAAAIGGVLHGRPPGRGRVSRRPSGRAEGSRRTFRGGRRGVVRGPDRGREDPPALSSAVGSPELLECRGEPREPVQRRPPDRFTLPLLQGQLGAQLPVVTVPPRASAPRRTASAPSSRSRCSGRTTSCPCCSSR